MPVTETATESSAYTELLLPQWLITMSREDAASDCTAQVLTNQAVCVENGKIAAVGPTEQLLAEYPDAKHTELTDHVLIPGLVNAHGHSAMSLFRGLADDLSLMTWLEQHIWPAESAHVSAEFAACGTELAIAEMLRSGTTCFADMYFFPETSAAVAARIGMRAQIAFPVIEFPSAWASGPSEYLDKGRKLIAQWKDHELLQIAIGPHAPYTVSDESLRQVAALSEESGAPIHIHLHETAFEVEEALRTLGQRPLDRLAELGCLTSLTQCVHMTQVADSDIDRLRSSGAAIIHSPESNLKLASGFCPVQRLLDAGIRLGLGTDGAASNNDLDMFGEMRTAALIGKAVAGRADAVTASAALHMATLGGAEALGLGRVCGSIECGKSADLTAVRLDGLSSMPIYDLVSHLVYSVNSRDVSDVWVAGQRQLAKGRLTRIDSDELRSRVKRWQAIIAPPAAAT